MNDPKIHFSGESIQGRRKNNEDSFFCKQVSENSYVFVVADGMGGTEFGEVASQLVIQDVDLFISNLFRNPDVIPPLKEIVEMCFLYIQERFKEYLNENPAHEGMGTTLLLLLCHNNCYAWGNIGDSRIYRIINNSIEQLSTDHTLLQNIIAEGVEPDKELISRYGHLLTKCINGRGDKPDIFPADKEYEILNQETGFILCTDGMIMEYEDIDFVNRIYQHFIQDLSLEEIVNNLISYSSDLGSMDNITVLAIRYSSHHHAKKKPKSRKVLLLLSLLLATFIVLFIFVTQFAKLNKQPISVFDSILIKNDSTMWIALDSSDSFSKKPSSFISWNPYPDQHLLRKYHLIISDTSYNVLVDKNIKKNKNTISLKSIKIIRFPGIYFLRIDATFGDGAIVVGNTIRFTTIDSINH